MKGKDYRYKHAANWIVAVHDIWDIDNYRVYGTVEQVQKFMFQKLREYEINKEFSEADPPVEKKLPVFINHLYITGEKGAALSLHQEYSQDDEERSVDVTAKRESSLPYIDLNAEESGWTAIGENAWRYHNLDGTYSFLYIRENPFQEHRKRYAAAFIKGIDVTHFSSEERKNIVINKYGGDYDIPDEQLAGSIARDEYGREDILYESAYELLVQNFAKVFIETAGEIDGRRFENEI